MPTLLNEIHCSPLLTLRSIQFCKKCDKSRNKKTNKTEKLSNILFLMNNINHIRLENFKLKRSVTRSHFIFYLSFQAQGIHRSHFRGLIEALCWATDRLIYIDHLCETELTDLPYHCYCMYLIANLSRCSEVAQTTPAPLVQKPNTSPWSLIHTDVLRSLIQRIRLLGRASSLGRQCACACFARPVVTSCGDEATTKTSINQTVDKKCTPAALVLDSR